MSIAITTSNFNEIVSPNNGLVVADFWAEWCGPCKMLGPVIDELSTEFDGKATIGKVNVDNESDLAAKFGVRSIPTVLFFKNGELVDKQVGNVPKSVLTELINKHLN